MSRGYVTNYTFTLGTTTIEAIFLPVPVGGIQAQLRRLRIGCPQSVLPPEQCVSIRINVLCGASGGSGGETEGATPLQIDPGDAPSVASGLVQLGNTTPNSGGEITYTYSGGEYLWIGDEFVNPNPPIVPGGYAIQVLIGPQSESPTPVPVVSVHLEHTETGGQPTSIAPPYVPIVNPPPFSVSPLPQVTSLAPTFGCIAGGTTVTIGGLNFTGATAVTFGATAATSFSVSSAAQIVAVSPAEPRGVVHVTVTTPAGTSQTSAADEFIYQQVPKIIGISPNTGSTAGGTTVTITGFDFLGASAVHVGAVLGTSLTVTSQSQAMVNSPANSAGTVDTTLTTPCGTSVTSAADQFTYVAPPVSVGFGQLGAEGFGYPTLTTSVNVVLSGATTVGSALVAVFDFLAGDLTPVITMPSGWVPFSSPALTASQQAFIYPAAASVSFLPIAFSSGTQGAVLIAEITNAIGTVDAHSPSSSGVSNPYAQGVTGALASADEAVIGIVKWSNSATTISVMSSPFAQLVSVQHGSTSSWIALVGATPGSTAPIGWTATFAAGPGLVNAGTFTVE